MVSLRERIRRKFRPKPKPKPSPPTTGGQSRPSGPVLVTPGGQAVGTAAPPKPTPRRSSGRGGGRTTIGGQSRPSGPVLVTPTGRVVGTAAPPKPSPRVTPIKTILRKKIIKPIIPLKRKPTPKPKLFTPLLKKDIITPERRREIIIREKERKRIESIKKPIKKFIPIIDKELGKERRAKVLPFIKKELGIGLFQKESDKEETKIQKDINTFAENRQGVLQKQVNAGTLSVDNANKKLNQDIDKRFNENLNKSEFFREKNPRKPTTNSVSFKLETERLKAIKEGSPKRADSILFLGTVAESPSSLIKLGVEGIKGVNKLLNDPQSRETSAQKIKEIFTKEKIKGAPNVIAVKATELANFVMTSPTTALAMVGGSLVGFSIVTKAAKPVLKVTGVISKKASKNIVKNLKFQPLVKSGLKDIGKITVEVAPEVFKKTVAKTFGKKVGRDIIKARKAPKKFITAFNKAVAQSVKESKVGKKLSRQQLRISDLRY